MESEEDDDPGVFKDLTDKLENRPFTSFCVLYFSVNLVLDKFTSTCPKNRTEILLARPIVHANNRTRKVKVNVHVWTPSWISDATFCENS